MPVDSGDFEPEGANANYFGIHANSPHDVIAFLFYICRLRDRLVDFSKHVHAQFGIRCPGIAIRGDYAADGTDAGELPQQWIHAHTQFVELWCIGG